MRIVILQDLINLPPCAKCYREFLPVSDVLFSKLYKACENKANVKILNFYDSEEFTNKYFYHCDHLNTIGAEKLTKLINEKIGE